MTKTKKNLTWKLKELPTASELADLVDSEVITTDEAREIVFGTAENDKEKIKALEEQLDFLRDLVKELAQKRQTTFIPYSRTIRYYNEPYWAKTNEVLCDAGLTMSTSESSRLTMTTGGIGSSTFTTGSVNALYNNAGSINDNNVTLTVKADTVS